MGIEAAGWRVVYANDRSEERAQIYRGFFGDAYRVENIFSVSPGDVQRTTSANTLVPLRRPVAGGQARKASAAISPARFGGGDILEKRDENAPPIVLMENVVGWLHSNGGADFRATAKSLNELGYACDAFMLTPCHSLRRAKSRPRRLSSGSPTDIRAKTALSCQIPERTAAIPPPALSVRPASARTDCRRRPSRRRGSFGASP